MGGHNNNPSVLVTGGAGFLGHALIHELLHDGSVLRARSIRSLDLKRAGHPAPVEEIVADITDRDALGRALEGVDVVFHTASVVDWGVLPDAVVESVNVEGTA
ncbi:MAG: NAD-dependent epimerase/dehydratase family protein, partial [Myxococcota bacterium]